MLKIFTTALISLLATASLASAQTPTPTTTPAGTPAAARFLTCQNSTGKVVFSLCGVSGCTATVTLGSNPAKVYKVVRTKNSDGTLSYAARVGQKPKCSATIGALRFGTRRALTVSCAPSLKNSACNIQ